MPRFSFAWTPGGNGRNADPRRRRPLLRPPGGQPLLLAAQQPALRAQLLLRERQPRQPRRRHGVRPGALGLDRLARPGPEHPAPLELEHELPARARLVGPLRRGGVRGRQGPEHAAPARHQPGPLRRQRGEPGRAEVQQQLPAAVQGLLEHPHAPDRRQLELQRAAGVPQQAPRRPAVHAQLHARPRVRQRQRQRRQPGRTASRTSTTTGAPSDQDRTHIFVGTWSYSLPFFKDTKSVIGHVLGGWELSGITRYQTGQAAHDHRQHLDRRPARRLRGRRHLPRRADQPDHRRRAVDRSRGVRAGPRRAAAATAPAARSAAPTTTSGTSRCASSSRSPATSGCSSRPTSSTPSTT